MKICSVSGCTRKFYGKGFCKRHWSRQYRTGSPQAQKPIAAKGGKVARSLSERFQASIQKTDSCWLWTGCVRKNGYGYLTIPRNKKLLAHRVAYELYHGQIPKGLCVLHHCDNRVCCNPHHLFLGTQLTNSHDALAKDRLPTGEQCRQAKVTSAQVQWIRKVSSKPNAPSRTEIAQEFGLTKEAVSRIVLRKTWKHEGRVGVDPNAAPVAG
jgi:hypothetical protein